MTRLRREAFSILRLLWVFALAFTFAWTVSAVIPRRFSPEALRYFDSAHLEMAAKRATLSYATSGLSAFAIFAALRFFSRSAFLESRFSGKPTGRVAAKMGFVLGSAASGLFSLVRLPFSAYAGHFLEKKFGLSRMTLGAYLADYGKSSLLDLLSYGLGAAFLAWALVKVPRAWHIVASVAFLGASVIMSALYPLVIAPAFNEFHPLEDPAVLEDVRSLSEKAGMNVDKVLVMEASAKTARVNAYFAGIGRTREVVLYDTLLMRHSREEVRLVIAHELGHWRYGHVAWGTAASSAGVFLALALFRALVGGPVGPGDLRSLGSTVRSLLVFVVLFSYVATPVSSFISRSFEVKADAFSLALTGDRDSFITSQVNLAKNNLSDVEPPPFIRWFAWTHPTTMERIASAE